MPSLDERPRHKAVQALTLGQLEKAVLLLEAEGWQRMGKVALARPTAESELVYWVQSMSLSPFEKSDAPATAG